MAEEVDRVRWMERPPAEGQPPYPRGQLDLAYKGTLHKKRGGMGRHMPGQNWQRRAFGCTKEGLLVYYESPTIQEVKQIDKPRMALDLTDRATTWKLRAEESDGPTQHMIIIDHEQHDKQRWKMCAGDEKELRAFVDFISKFCKQSESDPRRSLSPPPFRGPLSSDEVFSQDNPNRRGRTSMRSQRGSAWASRRWSASGALMENHAPMMINKSRSMPSRPRAASNSVVGGSKVGGEAEAASTMQTICTMMSVNVFLYLLTIMKGEATPVLVLMVNLLIVSLQIRGGGVESEAGESEKGGGGEAAMEIDRSGSYTGVEPGSTIPRVTAAPADGSAAFSIGDYQEFPLRTKNYSSNGKKKQSSKPCLFDLVAMDVFKTKRRVDQIYQYIDVDAIMAKLQVKQTNHNEVPALFIINVQMPVVVNSTGDGPGASVCFYFGITQSTADLLKTPKGTDEGCAVKLFGEWCRQAPDDPTFRGRFKAIGFINDIETVKCIPGLAKSYNGKPVLIKKTGSVYRDPAGRFIEMDVNVHKFMFLTRKTLVSMKDEFSQITMRVGFTIEGKDEEELPEVLLGCSNLHGVSLGAAVEVDW